MTNNEKYVNYKLAKIKIAAKRIFPHFVTEAAAVIMVMSSLIFSSNATMTATISQEMDIIKQSHFVVDEPQVIEPPQYADFEISGQDTIQNEQVVEYPTSQMCFIGDSRTVFMQIAMRNSEEGTDAKFIAKSSQGLVWFNDTAASDFSKIKDEVELCVVALGVNDIHNVDKYITRLNEFAEQYPDKVMVYVNIGPIDETRYKSLPNSAFVKFNDKIEQGLSDRWIILDQYEYLTTKGFETESDGLHYTNKESAIIFNWIVDSVKNQSISIIQ